MSSIVDIVGREILHWRGNPAIEVDMVHCRTSEGWEALMDILGRRCQLALTEIEAKARGCKYGKGVFPWTASGRSLSLGRDEGITKVLFDDETDRIIGCGIVGPQRRRPHRRGQPCDRDGRRCARHRPHHPSPSHSIPKQSEWLLICSRAR